MTEGMIFVNSFDLIGKYMQHLAACPAKDAVTVLPGGVETVNPDDGCTCGVKEAKVTLTDLKKRYTEHATNSGKLRKLVDGIPKMVTTKREQGQRMATDNDTAAANANGIFGVCNELDKIMKEALGEPPWNT